MWASNDLLKLKCVINKNELTCLDDFRLQAWLISICLFVTIMSPVELCVKWLFLKWFIRHKIRNQCAVEYLLHWKNCDGPQEGCWFESRDRYKHFVTTKKPKVPFLLITSKKEHIKLAICTLLLLRFFYSYYYF